MYFVQLCIAIVCSIFLCYLASISHVSLCKYGLGFKPNQNKINK